MNMKQLVAHKLAPFRNADSIVVMSEGSNYAVVFFLFCQTYTCYAYEEDFTNRIRCRL